METVIDMEGANEKLCGRPINEDTSYIVDIPQHLRNIAAELAGQ
jgi:hypothetical protein